MAASCVAGLGGPSHEEAYGMLAAMAEKATTAAEIGALPWRQVGAACAGEGPSAPEVRPPRSGPFHPTEIQPDE